MNNVIFFLSELADSCPHALNTLSVFWLKLPLHFFFVENFIKMFPGLRQGRGILPRPAGNLDSWAAGLRERSRDQNTDKTLRFSSSKGRGGEGRVCSRKDQPKVLAKSSSSQQQALAVAFSQRSKAEALCALEEDVYAKTSAAPQAALLRTWCKFHEAWFSGIAVDVFPLSVGSLRAVSAMFKAGQYASFKNYLYAARNQHIKLGHVWTQVLQKVAKDCARSVLRGIGPAKRSLPLDVPRALSVAGTLGWNSSDASMPVDMLALLITGIFFMCREIELSGALQFEAHSLDDGSSVTLTFPASKCDSEARGVTRTVDCLCNQLPVCPSHYMHGYLIRLEKLGQQLGIDSDALPLFPTPQGFGLTKSQVVSVIRRVVAGYDPKQDLCKFSGHSFRISGAQFYSELGLDPVTIGIHGRWKSNAIMRYLSEAPLTSIRKRLGAPHDAPDKREPVPANCFSEASAACRQDLLKLVVDSDIAKHQNKVDKSGDVAECATSHLEGYVKNLRSSRLHVRRVDSDQTHEFATKCGWKWAGKPHVFSCLEMPVDDCENKWIACPKCFPNEGSQISSDSDTSTTGSSSSSS